MGNVEEIVMDYDPTLGQEMLRADQQNETEKLKARVAQLESNFFKLATQVHELILFVTYLNKKKDAP